MLASTILMAPASPGGQGGGASQFILIGVIMVIFYFFMIRPQVRKSKQEKEFRESVKKGDKVVTIGGIHAKIVEVQEKTFIIEVEGGVRLKIERSAVAVEASKQTEK